MYVSIPSLDNVLLHTVIPLVGCLVSRLLASLTTRGRVAQGAAGRGASPSRTGAQPRPQTPRESPDQA